MSIRLVMIVVDVVEPPTHFAIARAARLFMIGIKEKLRALEATPRAQASRLFQEASLAVAVSVDLGVELVEERGLGLVVRVSAVRVVAGAVVASADSSAGGRASEAGTSGAGVVTAGDVVTGDVRISLVSESLLANGAGLAGETVGALLAAAENTALALELLAGDGREDGGGVVLGSVVVLLVDGDGGVHDMRLNGSAVDNRLDGLVDVVVVVLAADGLLHGGGVLALDAADRVLELAVLGGNALAVLVGVTVLELAVLDRDHLVVVLLGEAGGLVDGLDRGVVVVLVHLLVDDGGGALMLGAGDGLVGDGGVDLLVDSGVVLTRLSEEVLDGGLGRVHDEYLG